MATDNLYGYYKPSKPVAIAVCIVFIILTVAQLWRITRSRKWFGLAIFAGGLFEVVGLAARAYSRSHLSEKGPYIVQILLILLAPILFAASIYMFLGRLIRAAGHPELSFIRVNWLSKIFVLGDILCFLVQAGGASMLVNADSKKSVTNAQNIVLGGLALQVLFFLVFILCAAVFHSRVVSKGLIRTIPRNLRLVPMLFSLYLCSALVMVRNAYRLIEYKEGKGGYLQSHEWPTYGLDVILMAIVMALTLHWYSADLQNKEGIYALEDMGRA